MTKPRSIVLVVSMLGPTLAGLGLTLAGCDQAPPSKPTANTPPAKTPPSAAPASTPAAKPDAKPTDIKPIQAKEPMNPEEAAQVLGHRMNLIDGTPKDLTEYQGKVVLLVNVASACGLTPQYEGLEALYQAKKDAGLVILGFPANNFGEQEPGTNQEIASFCASKYHVSFPIFEKISVKGHDQHALYKQLCSQPAPIGGDLKWNFNKFLVDRTGKVVARFEPKVKPDDAGVIAKIDELLKS